MCDPMLFNAWDQFQPLGRLNRHTVETLLVVLWGPSRLDYSTLVVLELAS